MKNLFERLKPEFQKENWDYETLKDELKNIKFISDITLNSMMKLEAEFNIRFKNIYEVIDIFEPNEKH